MRIGVQPVTAGPHASPQFIQEVARLADELGFDSVQVPDHVVLPVDSASRYPYPPGRIPVGPDDDFLEPISVIAYLAGCTRQIRLGTSVLVAPYRHPVVTARQLACLDVLSGGRIIAGIGVGWMAEEFAAVGAPPFSIRGRATEEAIEIFRRIWRDQPASFEGEIYRFDPVGAMPKPVQVGGIPIVLGGNSRAALARAVRLCDGWQPYKLPPDELGAAIGELRQLAREAGRALDGFVVSARLGLRLTERATARRPEESESTTLVGTPEEVALRLAAYERLGINEVVFDFATCTPDELLETLELAAQGFLGSQLPSQVDRAEAREG